MEFRASRFGLIRINPDDIIRFPAGLIGLTDCLDWALLPDYEHAAVAWLQSLDEPAVALGVVSPRRFVPDYRVRVARGELASLRLEDLRRAKVLVTLGKAGSAVTLNLKAPLVINPAAGLGLQIVTLGDKPVQHPLPDATAACRRIA
jgi:flagellar assembly factor FliW